MTKLKKPKSTKRAKLITLLSRKNGADLPSLCATFDWLPHTTRAALSGLRKSGYVITLTKTTNEKPSKYQIVDKPSAEAS